MLAYTFFLFILKTNEKRERGGREGRGERERERERFT